MIFIIIILATALRLVGINQSLWLDESIGAIAVKSLSYGKLISEFIKVDNHPPLYYLLLKFWSSLFGYSEFALRSISILFGVGTIYITYLIARKLNKDKNVALVVALLLSISNFFIYYSQEARMYSQAAFFAAAVVYVFIKLTQKSNFILWILYSILVTSLVFTDYMPVFMLPIFFVWALIKGRKNKAWLLKFLFSHSLLVVIGILWLPTFLIQRSGGAWLLATVPDWAKIAGGANLKELGLLWAKFIFGRISMTNKKLYYLIIATTSIPVVLSLLRARDKKLLPVWGWLIVPIVLGFAVSFFFPAFIYYRFVYIVPAFYLLVAWGICKFSKKVSVIILLMIIIGNMGGWYLYMTDKSQQREMWRQAVAFVESQGRKDNVAIFEYPEPFAAYRWYASGNIEAKGGLDSIKVQDENKVNEIVDSIVKNKNEIFYFEYLHDLSDPGQVLEKRLQADGFRRIQTYGDFSGVGFITKWQKN